MYLCSRKPPEMVCRESGIFSLYSAACKLGHFAQKEILRDRVRQNAPVGLYSCFNHAIRPSGAMHCTFILVFQGVQARTQKIETPMDGSTFIVWVIPGIRSVRILINDWQCGKTGSLLGQLFKMLSLQKKTNYENKSIGASCRIVRHCQCKCPLLKKICGIRKNS